MDKELYIKRRNMIKEITKTNITIKNLKLFLKENEEFFKNKESLEALKNINPQYYKEKISQELEQTPISLLEQKLKQEINENKIKILKRKYK